MRSTLIRTWIVSAVSFGIVMSLGVPVGTAQDATTGSELKKRYEYWKNGPDGDILTQGVPGESSVAATTGPKGYALCVGVNLLDRRHYGDIAPDLLGAVPDAREMYKLAREAGYSAALLTDERATTTAVQKFFQDQAGERASGDIVLVYFAGYGALVRGAANRPYHALCLYDRMLVADELFELFPAFKTGVRVVMVTDSGAEGTWAESFPVIREFVDKPPATRVAKALSNWTGYRETMLKYTRAGQIKEVHGQPQEWPNVRIRRLDPTEATALFRDARQTVYRDLEAKKLGGRAAAEPKMNARVIHLAGNFANTPAVEVNAVGVYTSALLDAYRAVRNENYKDFQEKLIAPKIKGQNPLYFEYGKTRDTVFEGQRPFAR